MMKHSIFRSIILLVVTSISHASQSMVSPLLSQDVSEFYVGHLEKVDDVGLFENYKIVLAVEEGSFVKNVLKGKVVFVGKSKKFGKVVVMKHKDNLHTIYIHLSIIAPTLKVGTKLMQGYYLGKTTERFGFKLQRAETMQVFDGLKNFNGEMR